MFDTLKGFIKKQFIDVIEWTESAEADVLIHRFPMADNEIQNGASLTVRESQMAIFVNEGQVADVFGPGMYKLSTQTLPVLTYLKNWDKLFQSPFKSDVYFVSTRSRVGRRWGTAQPVTVRDTDFGMIQVRAFGQFAWRVSDAKAFFSGVAGTGDTYVASSAEEPLRGQILAALAQALGGSGVPFLDMAANQEALRAKTREVIGNGFAPMGLELQDFQIVSLNLPEKVQEALDVRMRMGVIGDMDQYTRMNAAEAIKVAAANEGGGVAGLGAQMAVGVGMGQALQQALMPGGAAPAAPAVAAVPAATAAAAAAPSADDPEAVLSKLKGLLDKGLISQADYDEKKAQVLAKLLG